MSQQTSRARRLPALSRSSSRRIVIPRWLGPAMNALLRSPLHRIVSGRILLLTIPGRRTGRPITVPLGYDEGPDGWYVIASDPETKSWWRDLSPDRAVTALIRGRHVAVRPEVLRWTDASARRFEDELAHYLRRFRFLQDSIGVLALNGEFDTASLRNAARRIVMVRLWPATPT